MKDIIIKIHKTNVADKYEKFILTINIHIMRTINNNYQLQLFFIINPNS